MSELLVVENLRVELRAGHQAVVKDISFSVDSGQSLILLGQSGSGKTMTCRAIMGLLDPKRFTVSGSIHFAGKDLLSMKQRDKNQLYGGDISFVPQNPMTALDPSMRIGKQMEETLRLHKKVDRESAARIISDALMRAGLADAGKIMRSFPFMLSGGMLQRVIIAMALMTEARLIIADEPTTALDVVHRNETIESFTALRKAGAAVLMVTHDFSAASQLGGELCIMKDGELIERGQMQTVLHHPEQQYTKALIEASSLSQQSSKGAVL